MSEDSVIVPIEEEDLLGAENSDEDVNENGDKIMSEFAEFAHYWKSFVRVANVFFMPYLQFEYLNELLSKQDLTNLAVDNWRKYINDWKKIYLFILYLLNTLKNIQTNNVLDEEQKNKNINYLNDLIHLLRDIADEKRIILTPLPPVPELNLQETASIIKKKEESKYKRTFHNLLHFYIFVYKEKLSSWNLLEKFTILFKNISSRRQHFDEFIRNYVINQEKCNEEVLQRWEELQQFLTSSFNDNPKETQQIEPKYTKEVEQSSQFYSFLQSLLKKFELKWTKQTDQLLNDRHKILKFNYCRNFIENYVEQLFLILLLDIKFDFRNFVRAHEATIQKTLNDNFLKQWRRMLHMPVTLFQFQQYRIRCCNLNVDQSEEWAIKTEKAIDLFKNIIRKIINYVINILIRLEILKNTSIILELDQLIEDSEYLNNLLQILTEIYNDERNILFPLPPVPNLNVIIAAHSPTSETESALSDVVCHLYHFYKIINKNPKIDFCEWNKELFRYISKDINSLDNFIYDYCKNQHDEKDVLSTWEEFKIFLSENKNIENNLLKTGGDEPNRFIELYRLIFKKNRQCERELQSVSPIDFEEIVKNDKMYEMQIYIILLLNVAFDIRIFNRNTTNLNSNLAIIFQFLLICFKCKKICMTIFCSHFNIERIFYIVDQMQILIGTRNKEDFLFYNDLNQFKNIFLDKNRFNSIEILEFEIENMHQIISNLNNDKNNSKKQNIILYNLYCLWRIFIKKEGDLKENFFQWNEKMFHLFFMKLNDIDSIINKLFTEDEKTAEMWRCFKKFLIRKYAEQEENDSNEIHHNVNFELFLNKNSSFPEGMAHVLNCIHSDLDPLLDTSLNVYDALYIFILLDSPFSLKQMATFVLEYKMSLKYDDLNCYKFIYHILLSDFNINEINKLRYFFSEYDHLVKNLNRYLYIYKILNKDHLNIMDCLKEIKNIEIKNDFFHLDKVPHLSIDRFQLQMNNNLFLIQHHQFFYLHLYFKITQINKLQKKSVAEKIRYILEYIYLNCEKLEKFVNGYFEDLEDTNVFQSNWNLIKETIMKLSLKNFNNCWQILFISCEKHSFEEYFKMHRLNNLESITKMNEKDAAQQVLLILLNVPMSEISESQYNKPLTLDDLFSLMIQYKKLISNLDYEIRLYLTQYNLTMDKFLIKLENVSNASEGENESSTLLVKSEFHHLEKQKKTAIIEKLVNIANSSNKHGYFITIFEILLPLLPLIDIILDIILVIKFFFSNELTYSGLTIGILLITGIATVITEIILKRRTQWNLTYYVNILNNNKLKYLFDFTQITLFLRGLNEALWQLEIKRKKFNSYLEYIKYGDPEFKKTMQTLKYVEMCFEAIPQTILQLFIILTSKEWGVFQIVSIFTSICNINVSVWNYISTRDTKKEMEVLKNKCLILREFCFYGARIISTSLMSSLFSWMFLTSWIGFHILMDLFLILIKRCGFFQNYLENSFIATFKFSKAIHTDFPGLKESTWNYISLIEFLIFTAICSVYVHIYLKEVNDHLIFVILFVIYVCLIITWAGLSIHIISKGFEWLFIIIVNIILLPVYLILLSLKAVGLINRSYCFENDDIFWIEPVLKAMKKK